MYDTIEHLKRPSPTQVFRAVHGPTIAKWTVTKRHAVQDSEIFQDVMRHPWVGERQAGRAANLYTMTARGVDQELRALPYAQRLTMPRGGLWPIVRGAELGEGPNPWDESGNKNYDKMAKRYGPGSGVPHSGGSDGYHTMGTHTSNAGVKITPTRKDVDDMRDGPGGGPPGSPSGPRTLGARLKNIGGHALNSGGEVGATFGGALVGNAVRSGVSYATGGKVDVGDMPAQMLGRTGNALYRGLTPKTGRRVGNRKSNAVQVEGAARGALQIRRDYRAYQARQQAKRTAARISQPLQMIDVN